ncbi:hypothetical protein PTKIN_Ptkin04bG0225100 [Pterospermum kingtungense]
MEGSVSKRVIISLVVLLMVVLAQGELANNDDHHPDNAVDKGLCLAKCPPLCALRIFPKRIKRCLSECIIECSIKNPSSEVDYNCASSCVNSMIDNAYNPTDVINVADAVKVESFVGSCYETCKNNNNN